MDEVYVRGERFGREQCTASSFMKGEYDGCTFTGCDLSGADLSGCIFADCVFLSCNLSMVRLSRTTFRGVVFKECKLLGVQFNSCNEFSLVFSFEDCILDHSSFYRLKLKKIGFRHCRLHEVDLTEADLSNSVFDHCDLARATFDGTDLEGADLRTAFHYSIDPQRNAIRRAKVSMHGLPGLLDAFGLDIEA